MRILVAGIGGVGGYLGAKLCALDEEVLFLARGTHAEKIEKEGLLVEEDEGSFTAYPAKVVTAETLAGAVDVLFLCVKSYDIEETIISLKPYITQETVIVPFANGVGHQEEIEQLVDAKVLHGAMYILAHKKGAGHVVKKGKVFMALFGHDVYQAESKVVAELFEKMGLRYKMRADIEPLVWKKYLFISTFGALTSYFDTTIREAYDLHENWARTLMLEISEVAQTKGVFLEDVVEKSLESASKVPLDASSSMHLDFQNRRKTEVETLCGYIVKEGQKASIPTPLMAKVYERLKKR